MKTTQYQPFWLLERVLFLSHYWHQKEYLDINEDHSISTILTIGKSTLFVSLLVSKRVLRYNWRPLNSQLFEYWKDYSICSCLVKKQHRFLEFVLSLERVLLLSNFLQLYDTSRIYEQLTVGLVIINDFFWKQ